MVGRGGCAGLDFVCTGEAIGIVYEVYLVAGAVAPKSEPRLSTTVVCRLDELINYKVFKQSPAQEMGGELRREADVEQRAGETSVVEIEFLGLDQTLREVVVVRLQEVDYIACLKQGEPRLRSGGRDSAFVGQRREIEQLAYAPGTELDETDETAEVSDVFNPKRSLERFEDFA